MGTMGIFAWILSIALIIVAVILVIVILMQTEKTAGESAITGGNTFYNSNKSNTLDGLLSKLTIIFGIIFAILCVLVTIAIMK